VGVVGLVTRTGAASTLFSLQGLGTLVGTAVVLGLRANGGGGGAHLAGVACLAAALFALQRYLCPPQ
jgi:hypothetical protein